MFDLYLITDPDPNAPQSCVTRTEAALAAAPAGRVGVQLRAKHWQGPDLLRLGRALRSVTRSAGAPLLVNAHIEIARQLDADGLHLPERSGTPQAARSHLGENAWIGRSCHDAEGLERAAHQHASFVTLSPFAWSPGKANPLGTDAFARLANRAAVPVFALGGIDAKTAPLALASGAYGLAVIRAVYGAADPSEAVTSLLAAIDRARGRC